MMTRMLNTALPTMVPTPKALSVPLLINDMALEASSGADEPAAMNVAPATSSLKLNASQIFSNEATKKSSHTIAIPMNRYITPTKYANIPPGNSQSLVGLHVELALKSFLPFAPTLAPPPPRVQSRASAASTTTANTPPVIHTICPRIAFRRRRARVAASPRVPPSRIPRRESRVAIAPSSFVVVPRRRPIARAIARAPMDASIDTALDARSPTRDARRVRPDGVPRLPRRARVDAGRRRARRRDGRRRRGARWLWRDARRARWASSRARARARRRRWR
mmetsp:Transcript_5748/g.22688  ORF Transcript_5748/g.22688 Transcript_5748/m.22688 type:complete len:279 (+) Transcript_5748:2064-2900(+)